MKMNSKERIFAALNGQPVDHIPLTTWCFGWKAPINLRWQRNGQQVPYWYSMRMEHIHTLPQVWELEDDFNRVRAWLSLGLDDILDVSVPWSMSPEVTWQDRIIPASGDQACPVLVREYQTKSGPLRHAVRQTGEEPGPGWVVQPDYVPLFEDFNIPRAVKHVVTQPEEVPVVRHLFCTPDEQASDWFYRRMRQVNAFCDQNPVAVQAWAAFGMDGVVWLMGAQGAVFMAMETPQAFAQLVDIIFEADYGRTKLAVTAPGVDIVVQRGWYSSTDFWSPRLFDRFVVPHLRELTGLAHRYGKKFAYVMTTGVEKLGLCLAEAGVDVLYFVDPVQDRLPLEAARQLLGGRMTLVGGTNALTLASGDRRRIREEVHRAIDVLGPTQRFILHPLDAIFPDTPWEGVEAMIDAWKEAAG
jgi:hypothetical protein